MVPALWSQLPSNRCKMPVLSLLQVSWRFKLLIPHMYIHLTAWSFCTVLTTHVCCFPGKDNELPGTKPQSCFELIHPHSLFDCWMIYPENQWSLCFADLCWQMLPALESSTPNSCCSTDKLVYEFLMHLSCSTGDSTTFVSVGDIKPCQCVSVVFCIGMS